MLTLLPSHSNSLPLVMNSSESVSSGVSISSTLMSRSSGVSRKSSDSKEPSLWSSERFISGATSVRRLRRDEDTPPPPPGGLMFRELGGPATDQEDGKQSRKCKWREVFMVSAFNQESDVTYRLCHLWDHRRDPCLRTLVVVFRKTYTGQQTHKQHKLQRI